jgi:hypothetical protein
MKKLVVFVFIVGILSCSDEERTTKVLAEQGYTNIQTFGHAYNCSNDDRYCTKFEATSPSGHRVHGAVGCGAEWGGCGKGCTIRFD